MLEDTKAKLEMGERGIKRESQDVAQAEKLLKQDENELARLRESLASGIYKKTIKTGRVGRDGGQRTEVKEVKMSDAMYKEHEDKIKQLEQTIIERKNTLESEQAELASFEKGTEKLRQNVQNLQQSVQTNNNTFQQSQNSGDGFFMGSIMMPFLSGMGLGSNYN